MKALIIHSWLEIQWMLISTAYLNKPISSFRTPHQVWREEIEHGTPSLGLWNYLHNPVPLSAQPSHTPGAPVGGLISFITWLSDFRRCTGCLCSTWFFKLWWYSKEAITLSAWSENCKIVLLLTALRFTDSSSWVFSCMDLGSCCGIWVSSKYLSPLSNWTHRERVLPSRGKSAKLPAPDPGSADSTSWMVALVCR